MGANESSLVNIPVFEYDRTLLGREIRLLKFKERREGAGSNLLNFDLTSALLPSRSNDSNTGKHTLPYIALSYVWGPPTPRRAILIKNKAFTVGINLERALIHLEKEIGFGVSIWIDAICINQAPAQDSKEKNDQVAQMKDVYDNAVQTIVWLGDANSFTRPLMAGMERIGKEAIVAGLNELTEDDFKRWPSTADSEKLKIKNQLLALIPTQTLGFPLKDLLDLSNRPWFRRVWIQQEFAVSRDVKFMCGASTCSGENLVACFLFINLWIAEEIRPLTVGNPLSHLASNLHTIYQRNGLSFLQLMMRTVFRGISATPNARACTTLGTQKKWRRRLREEQLGIMHEGRSLEPTTLKAQLCQAYTVATATGLEATEARDRIYALLGLASDREKLDVSPTYDRNPNGEYEKTDAQVFTEVARALIQEGHIDLLALCRKSADEAATGTDSCSEPILPSWVPDWSKNLLPPWGGYLEDGLFDASGSKKIAPHYSTQPTARNASPTQVDGTGEVLGLHAYPVGRIQETKSIWNVGWQGKWDNNQAKTYIFETMQLVEKSNLPKTPGARGTALWNVLIGGTELGDLGFTQRATEEKSFRECRIWVDFLFKQENEDSVPSAHSYQSSMRDKHNARPFLADGGRLVGLCPSASKVDDELFIPLGSHVPFVLRKVMGKGESELYEVVGEAYVYGMMDGEILKTSPEVQPICLV